MFSEIFNNPLTAIAFEKKIKGWNRKKKDALINRNYELLPELSLNTNKRHAQSSTGLTAVRQAQTDNAQFIKVIAKEKK